MGYTTGVKFLWELIDKIADDLIGTADWEEGDATWDTSDTEDYNAKRVCHHIADDEYLSLIMENRNTQRVTSYAARGLVIMFSTGWDAVNHEPTGTIQHTWIPFEGKAGTSTGGNLASYILLSYRLFTSAKGFALVGVPSPYTYDDRQSSFIAVVERNTDKLYADTFTNFYILTDGNYLHNNFYTIDTVLGYFTLDTKIRWRSLLRPYVMAYTIAYLMENPYLWSAYLSTADDKVYYTKPIVHNSTDRKHPVLQAEFVMFLNIVDHDSITGYPGIVDDDEIAEPGPSTKKYQVALKQSPDSADYMQWAFIKSE